MDKLIEVIEHLLNTCPPIDASGEEAHARARAALAEPVADEPVCRTDGRCQYAIDHGAEGLGHCPKGKCCMPAAAPAESGEYPPLPMPDVQEAIWTDPMGGGEHWSQYHDESDPLPTTWDDEPPTHVRNFYTADQMRAYVDADRAQRAKP